MRMRSCNMSSIGNLRLYVMGERPRTYADVSKLKLNMNEIKYRIVNATMDMPTNLKAVSDESTYLNKLSII